MPVVCHVICLGLFRILQYLQSVLLQEWKPSSLEEVSVGFRFMFDSREAFGSFALGL